MRVVSLFSSLIILLRVSAKPTSSLHFCSDDHSIEVQQFLFRSQREWMSVLVLKNKQTVNVVFKDFSGVRKSIAFDRVVVDFAKLARSSRKMTQSKIY